jgi:hypothetical protein
MKMELSGTKQAAEVWGDIEGAHRSATKAFEGAREKFMERFVISPAYAIEHAELMTETEFIKSLWNELLEACQAQDILTTEGMVVRLNIIKNRIMSGLLDNRWNARSSGAFYNASEMAKATAASKFYNDVIWIIQDAERSLKDEITAATPTA